MAKTRTIALGGYPCYRDAVGVMYDVELCEVCLFGPICRFDPDTHPAKDIGCLAERKRTTVGKGGASETY